MPSRTPNPFNSVFDWFSKDAKSGAITILVCAVVYLWFQNSGLQQARIDDREKFKAEIVKEVRRAYDPKFKEIADTVMSKSDKLDTSLENVNEFINHANKKLNKK